MNGNFFVATFRSSAELFNISIGSVETVVACLHAAGVTVATYRRWEKGGHIRGMHALDNLCYELEVSICWLLDGWGSFLTEDDPEFEDFDEFLAWSWRGALGGVRMALARGQAGIAPTAGN